MYWFIEEVEPGFIWITLTSNCILFKKIKVTLTFNYCIYIHKNYKT